MHMSQPLHSYILICRPLEKRTIFAHVLVCISHVLAAEPRRFLAILLVETGWDQKKTAVFPPYLKVVVACFVCVIERVGWTHLFGAFFCLSYFMCTRRFFDSLLVSCTWGAHKPLRGHAASRKILWNCPQPLHLGSVRCYLNQFFLAVTANYFILRHCYTWI